MSGATTNKLKVLFVSRAYGGRAGGMERLSWQLIGSVKRTERVEVKYITHRGARELSPLFVFLSLPKVLWQARWADVVHLGDPMLSFAGWLVKRIWRRRVAVTAHGLDILYPNFLYQLYLRLFFGRFDLYLPISQAVDELLKQRGVKGQIKVINPGITDRLYDPNIGRDELEKMLGRELNDKVVLLTCGRLVRRKGHAWFIREVLPRLPDNFLYVIAGAGPEAADISRAIEDARVPGRVRLLGRVSDSHLKILYNTVDAFIQPNISVPNDLEGFGLVLLEAAACGRTVFASNMEGMTDALAEGRNGTLLPAKNAAAWIAALRQARPNQPSQNKARNFTLNNYSCDKQANSFIDAIEPLR